MTTWHTPHLSKSTKLSSCVRVPHCGPSLRLLLRYEHLCRNELADAVRETAEPWQQCDTCCSCRHAWYSNMTSPLKRSMYTLLRHTLCVQACSLPVCMQRALIGLSPNTCTQVDQLLAVQFREDMVRLIDHVGRKAPRRQTILVSATLNEKVLSALSLSYTDPASYTEYSTTLYSTSARGSCLAICSQASMIEVMSGFDIIGEGKGCADPTLAVDM